MIVSILAGHWKQAGGYLDPQSETDGAGTQA
jgi:hypothetical protein